METEVNLLGEALDRIRIGMSCNGTGMLLRTATHQDGTVVPQKFVSGIARTHFKLFWIRTRTRSAGGHLINPEMLQGFG